jgi:hypothetical protein
MTASSSPLRLDRPDFNGLARALVVSLALHVLCYGGYRADQRFHWLGKIPLPEWIQRVHQALAQIHHVTHPLPVVEPSPPLLFVEVNPGIAVPEPPKQSKYYSSHNSRAANPDADRPAEVPKVAGAQNLMPKTEDSPRAKAQPQPLQPAFAPAENTEPEARLKPAQTPGELAFAKPQARLRESDGQDEVERPKPRTIAEARARQAAASSLAGEKMKQEGGVRPRAIQSTLDVTAMPFGAYDAAVIAAIQNRWYQLIDDQPLTRATGKVVLAFRLNYDGTVTGMQVMDTTVNAVLTAMCQRAVLDPAPYGVWPRDMRRMIAANFRDVTFTFYYY